MLKGDHLSWEHKVFNVDSWVMISDQGYPNELTWNWAYVTISFQGKRIGDLYIWPSHCLWLGNEADFIIISLVRTKSIGFLDDLRRTNVMLTRCKKGMVILANRRFLDGPEAQETLVHKLSQAMTAPWLTERNVLNGYPFA
jgi:AAA domain